MDVRWSPEQISHALAVEYQALYASNPVLQRTLRTRRWPCRRQHRSADAGAALG